MELVRTAHSLGEANFHLQFTPKYRRDVFRDGVVRLTCEESFRETAARFGFVIHAIEFGPEHVHLFIGACKNHSVSRLAQLLKGASARRLRQQCSDRFRDKLWGDSSRPVATSSTAPSAQRRTRRSSTTSKTANGNTGKPWTTTRTCAQNSKL